MPSNRPRHLAIVVYAVLAYTASVASTGWAVTFVADLQLPRGIDHGARHPAVLAVVMDLAVLLLFAVQHSVMARAGFKRWSARWMPPLVERSTYVLATSLVLVLLFWQWQPVGRPIWDLHHLAAGAVWAVFALGWLMALSSTCMIDHFEFFGLRRAYVHARNRPYTPAPFQERWLYALVRHPLMLGLLLAFWATPRMTAGHLLFAAAATGYIAVGMRFEERDLERELGEVYRDYANRVPALLPVPRPSVSRRRRAILVAKSARRGAPPKSWLASASIPPASTDGPSHGGR